MSRAAAAHVSPAQTPVTPEQIHLTARCVAQLAWVSVNNKLKNARSTDTTIMSVTWTTLEQTPSPVAQYSTVAGAYTSTVAANTTTFTRGGWHGFIHTAVMTGLLPGTRYFYRVGCAAAALCLSHGWQRPVDQLLERSRVEPASGPVVCHARGGQARCHICHCRRHGHDGHLVGHGAAAGGSGQGRTGALLGAVQHAHLPHRSSTCCTLATLRFARAAFLSMLTLPRSTPTGL